MERVKLGVIGLGLAWERLHAPALDRLKNKYEIVAVCDKDFEKARGVAQFLNLSEESAYDNYTKMLGRADIEAVESLVPISGNYETAAAVMRSGKHLIAEKPLASSPEAAKELIKLRDETKVKVMVAENMRYEEQNILIKNLITGGHIGNPVYFIDNHIVDYREQSENGGFGQTEWRQKPKFNGGVIIDSGVHHMARLRFLFGDAVSVFTHGRPSEDSFTPYSCVNALLRFGENVSGGSQPNANPCVQGHYAFFLTGKETQAPLIGLRIFGTLGEIFLEEPNCGYVNVSYKNNQNSIAISYNPGQGYFHELENFHAALRHNAKIESTPEKAMGDIETVFAIIESARLGEAINPKSSGKISQSYILPRVTAYPGARTT